MKGMLTSSKKFMITYIMIALNVIVYVYTSLMDGDFMVMYGQVNGLVMHGWYYQLFTSMFIHANLLHLLGNMFFLLIFGLRAEEIFSVQEYLLIYFSSGLTGNLLTLLLPPDTMSVGASGAIFGVFGACVIYLRRSIGQSIISALLYAFFLLMISISPGVNFLAHFGGLAAGLSIGYVLAIARKPKTTHRVTYKYSTRM